MICQALLKVKSESAGARRREEEGDPLMAMLLCLQVTYHHFPSLTTMAISSSGGNAIPRGPDVQFSWDVKPSHPKLGWNTLACHSKPFQLRPECRQEQWKQEGGGGRGLGGEEVEEVVEENEEEREEKEEVEVEEEE